MPDTTSVEFDLHGIVGIRLIDATRRDIAKVERQLGPLRATLTRDPDIVVRFVDTIETGPLHYVGLGQTGFNEDGFFVLQGKANTPARALIPFEHVGSRPEIVCERALPAVPHLLAIINLTALDKGVLPLHASAFVLDSLGVLVTGWAKSGKTESLLACMRQGASYVGDEWVYLPGDGSMLGVPEPIRLWAWHLDQMPEILASRTRAERTRLSAWKSAAALTKAAATSAIPGGSLFRKGAPIVARQAYVQIPPADLFGPEAIRLRGSLDAVVLVLSSESADIVVEDAGPSEVAGRMAASLADERTDVMACYTQFRYAFPERRSATIDSAEALESELLHKILAERPAAKVSHPYPCDIAELGRAVLSAARGVAKAPL